MSTFLQLVQDLHRESGASGSQPASVEGQTGEAKRLVNWIIEADHYVQTLYENWKFLRRTVTVTLTPGTQDYALSTLEASLLGMWDFETFQITPAGGNPLTDGEPIELVEYDEIKGQPIDDSPGQPYRIRIMPNGSWYVEGNPDDSYIVTGDWYAAPTRLAANSDVSAIPVRFHPVILGRALLLYANFENAPEAKTQGLELYTDYLARLENNQLPNKKNARFRTGGHFTIESD